MADSRHYPGLLIALEGPENGLRPRALEAIRSMLEVHGHPVMVTGWMGSPLAGGVYQKAAPRYELSPRTLTLLGACDLAERLEWEILPALEAGTNVLADRYLYRVALGYARDVDPEWLEVLCAVGPVPDAVLHFPVGLTELMTTFQPESVDLYEAGMDLGLTHDLPLSFRLYEERILEGYCEWAERHDATIEDMPSVEAALDRVGNLVGLDKTHYDARRRHVLELLADSDSNIAHSRQVAGIADRLFELTASVHGLSEVERELLDYAALLHDIGGNTLGEEHFTRSARRVLESELEGFNLEELELLATVIAFHHTTDPAEDAHEWMAALPDKLQATARLLGPILRLADALDSTRRQTVRTIDATTADGLMTLVVQAKDKAKQEIKTVVERASPFEQTYGLHLAIQVQTKATPPAGLTAVKATPLA